MVTATPPATTKTTWLDWLEPDEPEPNDLYTREQIADMASGIDPVTGDDIRYWEYQGVLPRSVRRRHEGATRAVYPGWYVSLARQIRQLQRKGLSLDEIRPQIRRPTTHTRTVSQTANISVPPSLPAELVAALNAFARHLADTAGSSVSHIEISIMLENGSGGLFGIPVDSNNDGEGILQ